MTNPTPVLTATRSRARLARWCAIALVGAGGAVMAPGAAPAQTPGASCVVTAPFTTVGQEAFTVPAGVDEIAVDAVGAQGGSIGAAPQNVGTGGLGAAALGTEVTVTPGETLDVFVGGAGGDVPADAQTDPALGGFNGGGDGGEPSTAHTGGGGGGASEVERAGTTLVIAGGGGGGAHGGFGGDGGVSGTDGTSVGGAPTGPGLAGGNGGTGGVGSGTAGTAGTNGAAGQGGTGGAGGDGGGGGGAGAVGGGGAGGGNQTVSGGGAGGGGGSSSATGGTGTTFQDGFQEGDGFVEIHYVDPNCTDVELTKTASAAEVTVGDTFTYTLTAASLGPNPATGVIVTDVLPAEVAYVSDTCGAANVPPWTWTIGNLAANTSVDCTITVEAVAPGSTTNTAVIAADQVDPEPADNTGVAPVIIRPVIAVVAAPNFTG